MTEDRIPPEFEDELRALREEPRPEFTRELDRLAAQRISGGGLPFRIRGWMPAAVGAAAAAAVAIVIVAGSGGGSRGSGGLDVAVVPDPGGLSAPSGNVGGAAQDKSASTGPSAAPAPGAEATPGKRAAPDAKREAAKPAAALSLKNPSVAAGNVLLVRYHALEGGEAEVSIGGRTATVPVAPGSGALRIATRGLAAGAQRLQVKLHRAGLVVAVRIR